MVTISKTVSTLLVFLFVAAVFLSSMSCSPSGNTNNANGGTVLPSATPTPSPSPTPVDCTKATPKEIVETIYRELEPMKLGDGAFDFNISVETPPVINIIGWSPKKSDILASISKIAPACTVPTSNPEVFVDAESKLPKDYLRVGCSGGLKPCGDVCIPPEQHCAWAGAADMKAITSGSASGAKPSTNANAAVNANSNSNTNTAKKP